MSWTDKAERQSMIGRVISSVSLNRDRDRLTIGFSDGGKVIGRTDGDCCSQSWVEHLTVPSDIEGATITGVTDSNYESQPPKTLSVNVPENVYLDVVVAYQESVQTDRGEIVIEFRNSSNGYYGGTLEWSAPA